MAKINLNVSIPNPKQFDKTLEEATRAGLKVTESFEDLGVATGSIDETALPGLRRVKGLNVEEDRPVFNQD